MPGRIEQITAFLAVAEHESFAAAARGLGQSPSSVTRAIADLEDRLGVQLFVRTTRAVSLTRAGSDFAARVRPLVIELDAAEDGARALQTELTGRIRISAPLSFGTRALAKPLSAFRQAHPGVSVAVTLSDRFIDIMTEGYDMALRISGAPGDLSTIWRKIRPIPRVMVASPAYLDAHGTPDDPRALSTHRCLSYSQTPETETWALTHTRSGQTMPVRLPDGFGSNNGDLLAQMALLDEGITLVPRFLVQDAIDRGRLVEVLPDWHPPEIWLTAFFPPYRSLPEVLQRFTETIEAEIGEP